MPSQDLFLSILSQSASHATARQLPLFLALTPLSTPGEGSNEFMPEETRSFAALLPFVRDSVRPGSTPAWHQPHALHSPFISLVVDPVGNILDVIGTQLVTKGRHRSISVGDLPRLDHSLRASPYLIRAPSTTHWSNAAKVIFGPMGAMASAQDLIHIDIILGAARAGNRPSFRQLNCNQAQGFTRNSHGLLIYYYALDIFRSLVLMLTSQVT